MTATIALIAALAPLLVLAQPAPTTFEAASVKIADPKSAPVNRSANAQATLRGGPGTADPGRISYANVTLQSVLITAYGANCKVQEDCDQIVGAVWLRTERFDIDAKIPAGVTTEQFRVMLQNLLAERFHMNVHHETRDLPGYELTLGKGKAKLTPSPPEELRIRRPDGTAGEVWRAGRIRKNCFGPAFMIFPYKGTRANVANHAIGREQSLADITKLMSNLMNSHVVDKTGLTGKYDFTLDWVPDGATMIQEADGPELAPPHGIPTAIEDQLGLKLVRSKVTLDTVIVDSADKIPTEN